MSVRGLHFLHTLSSRYCLWTVVLICISLKISNVEYLSSVSWQCVCFLWTNVYLGIPTIYWFSCFSVTKSCLTLCDPMDCRMPGFPVLHHPPELAQTHVSDAIQTSHPLLSSSPPVFIFPASVCSNESALYMRWPKYWSFISASVIPMNIQDWFPWGLTGFIFLLSNGSPWVFSKAIA